MVQPPNIVTTSSRGRDAPRRPSRSGARFVRTGREKANPVSDLRQMTVIIGWLFLDSCHDRPSFE